MHSFLTELYTNSNFPILSAALLGLLIAVAPCPMTLNITAIGFIGKNISNRKRLFYNGIFFTLGNMVSYSALAILIYFGANLTKVSLFFQQYSELIIGPILLVVGLYMTGFFKFNVPKLTHIVKRFENYSSFRAWDSFLLGLILSLAFCPYSGVLYFGMLMPLILTTSAPLLVFAFSFAAAVPVVIFAWSLAFTIFGIGGIFKKIKAFEFWFRKFIAFIFISVGSYYISRLLL